MRLYVITYSPTVNRLTIENCKRTDIRKAENVAEACNGIIKDIGRDITAHFIYSEELKE